MEVLDNELTETIKAWPTVSKVLSTLHTEEQYRKTVTLLDRLIDAERFKRTRESRRCIGDFTWKKTTEHPSNSSAQ